MTDSSTGELVSTAEQSSEINKESQLILVAGSASALPDLGGCPGCTGTPFLFYNDIHNQSCYKINNYEYLLGLKVLLRGLCTPYFFTLDPPVLQ